MCSCCSSQSLGDIEGRQVCRSCLAAYCRPEDSPALEGECQRCGSHQEAQGQGWVCSCGTLNTSDECKLCKLANMNVWQANVEEEIGWKCDKCEQKNITQFCVICANEAPPGFHRPPGVSDIYLPSLRIVRPSPLPEPLRPLDNPLMPEPIAVPSPAAVPPRPVNPLPPVNPSSPVLQPPVSPPRQVDSPVFRPVDVQPASLSLNQVPQQVPEFQLPVSPRIVDSGSVIPVSRPDIGVSAPAPQDPSPNPTMSQSLIVPKSELQQSSQSPSVALLLSSSQIWRCEDCGTTNTEAICTCCHSAMPGVHCSKCNRPSSSSPCPQCSSPSKKKGLMNWIKERLRRI